MRVTAFTLSLVLLAGSPWLASAQSPRPASPLGGQIQLEPPSFDQLFRAESDATARERLRQEGQGGKLKVEFPPDAQPLAMRGKDPGREVGPPLVAERVPYTLCYRPLYFEQRRRERLGEYIPGLQYLASPAQFYLDAVFLPLNLIIMPPWSWECSHDEPQPGEPSKYCRIDGTMAGGRFAFTSSLELDLPIYLPTTGPVFSAPPGIPAAKEPAPRP